MNKISLFTLAFLAVLTASAKNQNSVKPRQPHKQSQGQSNVQKQGIVKKTAAINANTFFSEDFGSGIPSTWTNVGHIDTVEIWTYAFGPHGPNFGPGDTLFSPTASNGLAILDDDAYGSGTLPTNADLITPFIDCSTHATVHISFYDYFLQSNSAAGDLSMSTDSGLSWHSIYNVTTSTVNPHFVDINVTDSAAGRPYVQFKFNYQGNWDYWWQLDDISVYELDSYDGAVVSVESTSSGCQLTSQEPVAITIRNAGTSTIGNFPVSFRVNGGAPVTETFSDTIASGDTAAYIFTARANLLAPSAYTIDGWVSVPSDVNTINDSAAFSTTHVAPIVVNAGDSMFMGFEDTEDYSGWTSVDANADGYSWGVVYFTPHSGTRCIFTTSAGSNIDDWLFSSCINLQAGTTYSLDYWLHLVSDFCTVETYIGNSNNIASMTQMISSTAAVVATWTPSTSTFTVPVSGTYYIGFRAVELSLVPGTTRIDDINLSIATAVNEINGDAKWFDVYPNPASDNVNIRINRPFNHASVTVINILGAVVQSFNADMNMHSIDISNLESGIYNVKLLLDGKEVNKRFTVSK